MAAELAHEPALGAVVLDNIDVRSWGLTISLMLSPPKDLEEAYGAFARRLQAALDAVDPGVAVVYPFPSLHITVASCISFFNTLPQLAVTSSKGSEAKYHFVSKKGSVCDALVDCVSPRVAAAREVATRAWKVAFLTALQCTCSAAAVDEAKEVSQHSEACPHRCFSLRMLRPKLGGSAGIFTYEDPSGAVRRIRDCLSSARSIALDGLASSSRKTGNMAADALLRNPWLLDDRANFSIPNIIHTTFMRFTKKTQKADQLQAAFAEVAASWEEQLVHQRHVSLDVEGVPYLHFSKYSPLLVWCIPLCGKSCEHGCLQSQLEAMKAYRERAAVKS